MGDEKHSDGRRETRDQGISEGEEKRGFAGAVPAGSRYGDQGISAGVEQLRGNPVRGLRSTERQKREEERKKSSNLPSEEAVSDSALEPEMTVR